MSFEIGGMLSVVSVIFDIKKLLEDGKEFLGEVFVTDSRNRLWRIKVRFNNRRQRYLKIKIKAGGNHEFRASADGYKPGEYVSITPEEWSVFYELANNKHNAQLYNYAQKILNRFG